MENIAKSTSYGCYLDCDFETAKYPDDKTHIVGLLAEYVYDLEQRILHYDERYIKLWNEIETLRERVSKEFDQEQQIADLEEKIKALQNGIIDDETLNMLVKEHKLYKDLEAKLAESEEKKESYRLQNEQHHLQLLQFYSRLGVEAFGADIHEKALETLMIMKEQLAEKDKVSPKSSIKEIVKSQDIKCFFRDKTLAQIQKCGDVYSPEYGYFNFEDDYDELLNNKKDDRFDIVAIEVIKTTKSK